MLLLRHLRLIIGAFVAVISILLHRFGAVVVHAVLLDFSLVWFVFGCCSAGFAIFRQASLRMLVRLLSLCVGVVFFFYYYYYDFFYYTYKTL